ncbi:hypothetical protein BGX28_004005 [Mortierella sp. GBA30]|nr:hypothetical protein BGX28_004005 [Mortierella sp. GBA30]
MPSSPTHNIVRLLQLLLSISVVSTAAFLLHYRTQSHSNFTNEPLVSCISGGVAFIYAFWALLNHRRQPDNHRWKYLHGLGCIIVCGLLIAGSVLAFVFSNQGVLCQNLKDAKDVDANSTTSSNAGVTGAGIATGSDNGNLNNIYKKRDYPQYQDGRLYSPGELCENYYAEMDKAVAVMGIVAAFMWMVDFCLIFGFCGSSGRYGPHREYPPRHRRRRGQISPEDEDDYPAGEGSRPHRGGREDFDPPEDYYDTLDQRKRELGWLDQRNRTGSRSLDDAKNHVQGPIPLSMRQGFFNADTSPSVVDTTVVDPARTSGYFIPKETILTSNATSTTAFSLDRADAQHSPLPSPAEAAVKTLSPAPFQSTKWVQQPSDSPTLLGQGRLQQPQLSFTSERTSSLAAPLCVTAASSTGLTTVMRNTKTEENPEQLATIQQPLAPEITETSEHEDSHIPSTASSPRYIVFPPGPACYVFESSQQEFLPSYVNMAARIEQKQTLKQCPSTTTSVAPSSTAYSMPLSSSEPPTEGRTGGSQRRIVVTGLGFDVVTKDDAEMAIDDAGRACKGASISASETDSIGATCASTPEGASQRSPSSSSKGTHPLAVDEPSSKNSSPKSSNNTMTNATTCTDSSGTNPINKKPAMTKRKTSKLSIITLKSSLQNSNTNSSGVQSGFNSVATSAVGTPNAELSPLVTTLSPSEGTSSARSTSPRSHLEDEPFDTEGLGEMGEMGEMDVMTDWPGMMLVVGARGDVEGDVDRNPWPPVWLCLLDMALEPSADEGYCGEGDDGDEDMEDNVPSLLVVDDNCKR